MAHRLELHNLNFVKNSNNKLVFQIHFHGQDLESLHSHIDPKFLPKAYGGLRPEYSYTDWVDNLVHNKDIVAGKSSVVLLNVGYFEHCLDNNLKSFLNGLSLSKSVRKQISTYTPFVCTVLKYTAQLSQNKHVRTFMHNLRILLIIFLYN